MHSIQGIVTIVQEGRFQVLDEDGVSHHFLLSHRAAPEPEQLSELQKHQSLVRVWFKRAPDVIGHVAARIDVIDRQPVHLQAPVVQTASSTDFVHEPV